jgi:hypothetical protein
MAVKTKKKKKPMSKEILKEIDHLKKLVRYSLAAVDHRSLPLDEVFVGQANKLMKQIKKLEESQ